MTTPRYKYYKKLLDTLVEYNNDQNAPLYNEKSEQAISKVIADTEEEERNIMSDANNVTMETFCQSSVTTNAQRDNENTIFASER